MFSLETFLVVNNNEASHNDFVSVATYVKMSKEHKGSRFSPLANLDSLYLDMSINLKWHDLILLDTTFCELNLWHNLIEAVEILSKGSSCKVRLGIGTGMLSVEETLQGEVNWCIHDEFEITDIYFKVKIKDKKLLLQTIIDEGIAFYSTLSDYEFENEEYINYCLIKLGNLKT
jgi:hypothetical protein